MEVLLTTGEVAKLAGVSRRAVQKWEGAMTLGAVRIGESRGRRGGGRERLFLKIDVEKFLKDRAKLQKARRSKQRRKNKRP